MWRAEVGISEVVDTGWRETYGTGDHRSVKSAMATERFRPGRVAKLNMGAGGTRV